MAGTETTASTLRWCLLALIHYPEAQMKMREEIKSVIGNKLHQLLNIAQVDKIDMILSVYY